jgi:hypothetical protein
MAATLRFVSALGASFLVGALIGACGPARSLCATVACDDGRVCEESTGRCIANGSDAGTDAGVDAGTCSPACAAPQVCNPASNTCVQCVSDSQCACPASSCTANQCVVPSGGRTPVTPSDSCTGAPTIRSCGANVTFQADLSTATDSLSGSCSAAGAGGRDRMVALVLDATADVTVTATASTGSSAQPVVYLLDAACSSSSEFACADSLTGSAHFTLKSLPAGTYTLVVDSYSASAGGLVDVALSFAAPTLPANETCATASPLPIDGGAVQVDLSTANDDLQISCDPASVTPDVVYSLTLSSTADVVVTASGGGANPSLALRSSPCRTGAQVQCANAQSSGTETLRRRSLTPGTWYVVVQNSGALTTPTPVTVKAVTTTPLPPPPNDTCGAPRDLTFAAGSTVASFSVDTSAATDDYQSSCNGLTDSPEVVYALTLGTRRTVTVTARSSPNAGSQPSISLRSAPCSGDADAGTLVELACSNGTPTSAFIQVLDPGTYYLLVEAQGAAGAGPTDVTVSLAP